MNHPLSPSDQQALVQLVRQNKTIEAIKLYREKTGADLAAAKNAIDLLQAGQAPHSTLPAAKADRAAVLHLYQTKGKIAAIKLYRDQVPGCELKQAKEAVEQLARESGVREPAGGCLSMVAALVIAAGAAAWGAWRLWT